MIGFAVSAVLICQVQDLGKIQAPTATELISKALARYHDIKTLSGTIRLVQSAKGVNIGFDTSIQIEAPSKIYLFQHRASSEPKDWLTTSDGNFFSYSNPAGLPGSHRVVESVATRFDGKAKLLTYQDIYTASLKSLGDRNPILDIVIGRPDDLRARISQWPSFKLGPKVSIGKVDAWEISGALQPKPNEPPTAQFAIYITQAGDIVRYRTREQLQYPNISAEVIVVDSVWDANLIVNGPVNPALFSLVR